MLNHHNSNWKNCDNKVFWGEMAPCDHLVQVYEDEDVFLNSLENFASAGINSGECVIIIATTPHLYSLERRLRLHGLDIEQLMKTDQYIPLNATEMLSKFMVRHWPDEKLFKELVTGLISRAKERKVRAFGEMVAILWEQGYSGATVHLEHLWEGFCKTEAFCLFCAYPKAGFTENSATSIADICAMHSKVIAGWQNPGNQMAYANTMK